MSKHNPYPVGTLGHKLLSQVLMVRPAAVCATCGNVADAPSLDGKGYLGRGDAAFITCVRCVGSFAQQVKVGGKGNPTITPEGLNELYYMKLP